MEAMRDLTNRFAINNAGVALAVDRVNDAMLWGARSFLRSAGFVWIDVPTITQITGACENVDTLYAVQHAGAEAYLAQTGQLYLEAKVIGHQKVWTIIQSNRAEECADARHLNQFQLVEFEEQGDFERLLERIEAVVKAMMRGALAHVETLRSLGRDTQEIDGWVAHSFARLTYTQAIELLTTTPYVREWGEDLGHREEQEIVKQMGWRPTFITHYLTTIKFFNMRENRDDPRVVNSADLLLPYSGECVGSAERENDYRRLKKRLIASEMFRILSARGKRIDDFAPYLDLIREHPLLHAGCGIGFARVAQAIFAVDDIRMVTPYPITARTIY